MDELNTVRQIYGMKINVKKTKVMCIRRKRTNKIKITTDGVRVEQVDCCRYLCSTISADGYCEKEIRSRNEMVNKLFQGKKKLFTSKLNLEYKKRIN